MHIKEDIFESKDIKVINRYRLERAVIEFIKESNVSFTEAHIKGWYNKLKVYTNVSDKIMDEHVSKAMKYKTK